MRRAPSDGGFTLVELMVVSALTLVVLTMAFAILRTTQQTATTTSIRAVNSVDAREALTSLEADLRFATQVSVCASATTATCATPAAGGPATLAVASATGAACTDWKIQSSGITNAGVTTGLWRTVSGTTVLLVPGLAAAPNAAGATTSGFSLPLSNNRLVEIDLAVNTATAPSYKAADTVTVHDLISPDDAPFTQASLLPSGWAC
jgi:prepilin-type N-terminal cleavage/methylation domain-containing protein